MNIIRHEEEYYIVFIVLSLVIFVSFIGVLTSFDSNYSASENVVNEDSRIGQITEQTNEEVQFSELSESEKAEFLHLVNEGPKEDLSSLNDLTKQTVIIYDGDKYVINKTSTFVFKDELIGWGYVGLLILSLIGATYAHERRVELRLQKLETNPIDIIDLEERTVKRRSVYDWEEE